jgi:hypothetical protein
MTYMIEYGWWENSKNISVNTKCHKQRFVAHYLNNFYNMKNEHSLLFIFRTTSLCASRTNIFIIWYVYILWCKILSIFLLGGIHISLISRLNTNVMNKSCQMWKVNRWQTTNGRCQVMPKAHIAFGKVG